MLVLNQVTSMYKGGKYVRMYVYYTLYIQYVHMYVPIIYICSSCVNIEEEQGNAV